MRRILVLACALGGAATSCDADGGVDPIVSGPSRLQGGAAGAGAGGKPVGGFGGTPQAGTAGVSPAGAAGGVGVAGAAGEQGGECLLVPAQNGSVGAGTNPQCGLHGAWYVITDCSDSTADCSQISYPPQGTQGFPCVGGNACVSGTTAAWATPEESTDKWGAGIGLGLNEQGSPPQKQPIGELGIVLKGFRFQLTGQAPGLYVAFPVLEVDPQPHLVELGNVSPGEITVYFSEARQDEYVQNPTPLDPSEIRMIQFHIRSQNTPVTFSFCISELTALY